LSVLAAMIILSYALNRFTDIPPRVFEIQLPGFFITMELNDMILTAILVAGLTAAGVSWLLRDHPAFTHQRILPHILLPAITALVIGIPLNQLPFGISWWVGLLVGTIILVMVLVGEYIAVDTKDVRQPLAAAGLSAVTFAIYLILVTYLRASGARLFYMLPAVGAVTWLVSLRSLNLRLHGVWTVYEALIIALVVSQLAAALHYWPLAPIRFGLVLLGPAYALTSLFGGLIEEKPFRDLVIEPLIVLGVSWVGALLLA